MVSDAASPATVDTLLDIMARLRDPQTGCPWDLEQDFRSIAPYTLEEAYEVVDAIERDDSAALQDELGDLLFQVVYHAQMAQERGWFDFNDVVSDICEKMVRRHPHVFADEVIEDCRRRHGHGNSHKDRERGKQQSALDGVPLCTPGIDACIQTAETCLACGF